MNYDMTRSEFESLPYRDDVREYVPGQPYRSRGDKSGVYFWMGTNQVPWWNSFTVDLWEDK